MSLEFTKISGSTPYFLNSASTSEELTVALEDYMRTGTQIIFQHDGEDCILSSFEYKAGIDSTVIAYFVTPKKKLLKVDTAAGWDLVITESEITPELDKTLTQENKAADAKATGEAITSLKSTIDDLHTDVEIWMYDGVQSFDFVEFNKEQGATVNIELVDTLPETLPPLDEENMTITVYVVNGTGIVYGNMMGQTITLGESLFGDESFNRGWTTDINAETEKGIYSVRAYKDFAEKKDITWENLPDKPFGEITENLGDTVTWDGNIDEGNDVVTNTASLGTGTMRYVKVSDCAPTIDDVGSNPTFKLTDETGTEQTPENVQVIEQNEGCITIGFGFPFVSIALTDNATADDIVFPEKGVYFLQMITADGSIASRCTSLTIPNYNFGTKTTLKKIDEKYLPESGVLSIKKIEFTDRPSAWEWFKSNYAKAIKATLTASLIGDAVISYNNVNARFGSGGNSVESVYLTSIYPYTIENAKAEYINLLLVLTDSDTSVIIGSNDIVFTETPTINIEGAMPQTLPDAYWAQVSAKLTVYYID